MSDRGFLFLFSIVMIVGSLAMAGWLLATGQAATAEGLTASRIGAAAVRHCQTAGAVEAQSGEEFVTDGEAAVVRAQTGRVARLNYVMRHDTVERHVLVKRALDQFGCLRIAPSDGPL